MSRINKSTIRGVSSPVSGLINRKVNKLARGIRRALSRVARRNLLSFDNTAQAAIDLTTPIKVGRYFEITGCFVPEVLAWRSIFGGVDFNARLNGSGQFELLYASESNVNSTCRTVGVASLGVVNTFTVIGTPEGVTVKLNDEKIGNATPVNPSLSLGRLGRSEDSGTITTAGSTSLDGSIFDVKMWINGNRTTGELVLDMPLGQTFAGMSRYVENRVATLHSILTNLTEEPLETSHDSLESTIGYNNFSLTATQPENYPRIRLTGDLVIGRQYLITATVDSRGSNNRTFFNTGGASPYNDRLVFSENSLETKTRVITAEGYSLQFYFNEGADTLELGSTVTVTNFSVKEVSGSLGVAYNTVEDDVTGYSESNDLLVSEYEAWSGEGELTKHGMASDSTNSASNYVLTLTRTNPPEGEGRWTGVQFQNLTPGAQYQFDIDVLRNDVPGAAQIANNDASSDAFLSLGSNKGTLIVGDDGTLYLRLREGLNGDTFEAKVSLKRVLDNVSYPAPLAERYFTTFDVTAQSHMLLSNAVTLSGDYEIEYWVSNPAGLFTGNHCHLGLSTGTACYFGELNGSIRARPGIHGVDAPVELIGSTKMHRFNVTRVGTDLVVKIDGVTVAAEIVAVQETVIDAVGMYNDLMNAGYTANGVVSDIKIWDGGNRDTGTLVLDMPIDESDLSGSTTVADQSSQSNHGMAYNFVPADTEHFTEDETFGWVGDDLLDFPSIVSNSAGWGASSSLERVHYEDHIHVENNSASYTEGDLYVTDVVDVGIPHFITIEARGVVGQIDAMVGYNLGGFPVSVDGTHSGTAISSTNRSAAIRIGQNEAVDLYNMIVRKILQVN